MTIKELLDILIKADTWSAYLEEVRDESVVIDGDFDTGKLEEELKKWKKKK